MGTKVTVVTLYDDSIAEHYVTVVQGKVDDEGRRALAEQMDARLPEDLDGEGEDGEDERVMYFREVEAVDSWEQVSELPNMDGRRV